MLSRDVSDVSRVLAKGSSRGRSALRLSVKRNQHYLEFSKIEGALWTSFTEFFENFAESYILSCWLQFDNKMEVTELVFFFLNMRLKLKLRMFLEEHIVAMVTYCATKLTATCSLMIGHFFFLILWFGVDRYRVSIITHKHLGKSWKVQETVSSGTFVSSHLKLDLWENKHTINVQNTDKVFYWAGLLKYIRN